MTRVKGGTVARNRRKKILKEAKGYFGSKHRLFKTAKEQVMHSSVYAYRDRKQNKSNFRKLWITRINAACRENEISYSKFINGLTKAGLVINRKMLSEIAIDNPESFVDLVDIAKDALNGKEYKPKAVKLNKTETKEEVKKNSIKAEAKKTETKATPKKEVKKATPKKEMAVPAKKVTPKKETATPAKKAAPKKEASKTEKTVKKPAAKKTTSTTTSKKATKKSE